MVVMRGTVESVEIQESVTSTVATLYHQELKEQGTATVELEDERMCWTGKAETGLSRIRTTTFSRRRGNLHCASSNAQHWPTKPRPSSHSDTPTRSRTRMLLWQVLRLCITPRARAAFLPRILPPIRRRKPSINPSSHQRIKQLQPRTFLRSNHNHPQPHRRHHLHRRPLLWWFFPTVHAASVSTSKDGPRSQSTSRESLSTRKSSAGAHPRRRRVAPRPPSSSRGSISPLLITAAQG